MSNVFLFPGSYRPPPRDAPPQLLIGESPTGALVTLLGDNLVESLDAWGAGCRVTSIIPGPTTSNAACCEAMDSLTKLVTSYYPPRKMICVVEGSDQWGWFLTALVSVADVDDALKLTDDVSEVWPASLEVAPSILDGFSEALHIIGRVGLLAQNASPAVA